MMARYPLTPATDCTIVTGSMKRHRFPEDTVTTLKSGRVVDANRGIVGINQTCCVYEGYDEGMHVFSGRRGGGWSQAEREELADHMIALWTKFKTVKSVSEDDHL